MAKPRYPDVFTYTDYRRFLMDCLAYKRKLDPGFTLRAYAREAGLATHSTIREVMDGKRNVTKRNVRKFIAPFKLGSIQADYFENLAWYTQAKTDAERSEHMDRLAAFGTYPRARTVTTDQYEFYSHWYNAAVRALVSVTGFRNDKGWIAAQVWPRITPGQANRALKLLERLGYIEPDGTGGYVQKFPRLTVDPDATTLSIREFNRSMIELAKQAIEGFAPDEREISGTTISCSREKYRKIKEKIRAFKNELAAEIVDDHGPDEMVAQINFQLFPLVKPDEEKK